MPSCGIILFTIENDEIYFLLKKRRDSISFVSLIRNANRMNEYELNKNLSLLTKEEMERIQNHSFEEVWDDFNIFRKSSKEQGFAKRNFEIIKSKLPVKDTKKSPVSWGFCKEKRKQISRKKFKEHELNCALRSIINSYGKMRDLKILESRPVIDRYNLGKNKYSVKYFLGYLPTKIDFSPRQRNSIRQSYITPYTSEVAWIKLKEARCFLTKRDIEFISQAHTTINMKNGKFQYKNIEQIYKVIENYDNKMNIPSYEILDFIE